MLPVSVNLAAVLTERLVSHACVRSVTARFAPDISREDLNSQCSSSRILLAILLLLVSILQHGSEILVRN